MTHTATQMIPAVGKEVMVRTENWTIPMRVLDVKNAWGKVRLLVTPIHGEGEAWVELDRVERVEKETSKPGLRHRYHAELQYDVL